MYTCIEMYCVTFKQTFVVFLTCHFWPHLSSSTTDSEYDSTNDDPLIGTENPLVNDITPVNLPCEDLLMGQYYCEDPEIDPNTQQAKSCEKEKQLVQVDCFPVDGILCDNESHNGTTVGFQKSVPCNWTNGKHFSTALLLSVFLGMFGVDRFYLGYPAIGMVKLCTMGFMFLGQLLDIILIAMQVVVPSDGSHYIIDYYGAGVQMVQRDNDTYMIPP